ncbi:hypothetical protein ACWDR0_34505 [Streptomyces sp. NPDC003691]
MSVSAMGTGAEPAAVPERGGPGRIPPARLVGWGVPALFLAAFAAFEAQKYGAATVSAALLFLAVPDLARRAVGGRGPVAGLAFNGWIPLGVLVAYAFGPVVWPPLFTAALAWELRVVTGRMLRRG